MTGQCTTEADTAVATPLRKVEPDSVPTDYDLLPYPSMPLAYTQPAHLAALATLFGLAPPNAEQARVLELGCAAGGNIIPLAARFPQASFLGIDLSQRHIADGQDRIATLGLCNVRLQQSDLTTLELGNEEFDYIICHGVFSWVPEAARDAIFRLCRDNLAANGMATISYNVLPGWHLRTAIRDLCLRYAGTQGAPWQRVARARTALARIAEASDSAQPYGMLLQSEAKRLKGVPAAYILGEFLAPDNAPCHVRDFTERAAACELDYLCEADLFAALPPALDPGIRDRLTAFTGADRTVAEQDIDFLTGRLFRRSVLVRRRPSGSQPLVPDPDQLQSLHVSSPLRRDATSATAGAAVFTDDQARPVTIRDPAIAEAIARLGEAYPGTLALDQLSPDSDQPVVERIRRAVFALVMTGRTSVSTLPLSVGRGDEPHPIAWPVARAELALGQPWVTSLHHTGVPALPILKLLLPILDGMHDRVALREAIISALQAGAIPMPAGETPLSRDSVAEIAEQCLAQSLAYLSRRALLQPA